MFLSPILFLIFSDYSRLPQLRQPPSVFLAPEYHGWDQLMLQFVPRSAVLLCNLHMDNSYHRDKVMS